MEFHKLSVEEVEELRTDIILGSEISYVQNHDTLESLLNVIDSTLREDGVFYLVQSTDRGTSHIFTEVLQSKYGFNLEIHDVPPHILDFYATGQLVEKYQYYTFKRPNSKYPVMKYDPVQMAHLEKFRKKTE